MTVRTEDGTATTTYATWDNFVPHPGSPATLKVGNGRLAAIGASPGGSVDYGFDVCDRLTAAPATGAASIGYTYHAGGLLASTTQGGAGLAF